jgi:hypothetical protein
MGLFRRAPGAVVDKALASMALEIKANERDGRGLMNRPRYVTAKDSIVKLGASATPHLLRHLEHLKTAERGSTERDLGEDVIEILGKLRDPDAVPELAKLLPEFWVSLPNALASTDEGTQVLLAAAASSDRTLRANAMASGTRTIDRPRWWPRWLRASVIPTHTCVARRYPPSWPEDEGMSQSSPLCGRCARPTPRSGCVIVRSPLCAGWAPASSRDPERRNRKVGDEVHRRQVPALLEQEVQEEAEVHPLHEVRRQSWPQLDLRALQEHRLRVLGGAV